jgi:thiamine pyrophosphokinase
MFESNESAVLFLNGEIDLDFCRHYIQKEDQKINADNLPIYCTDGAFIKIAKDPFLVGRLQTIYGDMDSLAHYHVIPEGIRVVKTPDQNHTDFEKTLHKLMVYYNHIDVFGASGGEMDHFLTNISVALRMMNTLSIRFIDSYAQYFVRDRYFHITNVKDCMVSIVPLGFMKEVTLKGFTYPLENASLQFDGLMSTRNSAYENEIEVQCREGKFIIFISHKPYRKCYKG